MFSTLVGIQVRTRLRSRRRGAPQTRLTDEQVLEARHLHEKYGFGAAALLRHYHIKITNGSRHWMGNILNYRARSSPTKPLDPSLEKRK